MDDAATWQLTHHERAKLADTLATLTPQQWDQPSTCGGWTVRIAAGHVVAGAEQTKAHFIGRMLANGMRFNTMIDRDARNVATSSTDELIDRLRARLSTTNGPPAPAVTMLGEVVVHTDDIRRPLGLSSDAEPEAVLACLEMYKTASFPVGTKKRIEGLRLVATDVGWSHGTGPEVSGPGLALLSTMTGRRAGLADLGGDGLATLRQRMAAG